MVTFSRGKPRKQQKGKITCHNPLNKSVENWVIFTWFALSSFICLIVTVCINCPPFVHEPSHLQIARRGVVIFSLNVLIYCCWCSLSNSGILVVLPLEYLCEVQNTYKKLISVVKMFQISL